MKRPDPSCRAIGKWLQHHCGKDALAPLTGQDIRALHAFVHLVELYAVSDIIGREYTLVAMATTVMTMQPKTRYLAKRSIPHVLDWGDEEIIWSIIKSMPYRIGDVENDHGITATR